MLLRILLWVLHLRLGWLSRFNSDFKSQLTGKNVVVQVKTLDDSVSRYYAFQDGSYRSRSGVAEDSTVTLGLKDATYAKELLTAVSKQGAGALMKGMAEQKIKLTGDMPALMQLAPLLQMIPPGKAGPANT